MWLLLSFGKLFEMNYLEILLLLFGLVLPFYISMKMEFRYNKILLMLLAGALITHGIIEGLRWQMIPIYLINLITMVCLFKGWSFFKGNWFRKIASGLFLTLFLVLGFSFSTILPVFDLPEPTGKYKIGSDYFHLITDEDELLTEEKEDKRALSIKVWYPANVQNEQKETYLNDGDKIGFATKYGLPKGTFNYLNYVKTNTFEKPSVADGKFPVLVFSHGHYSKANGYYALIEEVVSQGFIVLNINHTFESVGTQFPSGEIKLYNQAYDKKHNNQAMADMIWETMEAFKSAKSKDERSKVLNSTLKNYFAAEITHRWANDIDLVINEIPTWEKSTFLSNHMDTSKIGVFGHSQGAAAAGQALLDNPKIQAGINLDGVQWGNMVDTFLSKPFLLLSSDWAADHPDFNEIAFQNKGKSDFYTAKIKNSGHSSFMDIPLIVNFSLINEAGNIEPNKATEITAKIVVKFFKKYLNEENNNLLELSKKYSELEIDKTN